MSLDPDFELLLREPGMQLSAPPPDVTPEMMREAVKMFRTRATPPPISLIRNIGISTPTHSIPARIYYPALDTEPPVVLFFHGGGWTLCDLDSHDFLCRDLAHSSNCAIVAIGYRLAPETPFPGALEDCDAAFQHITVCGQSYGLDSSRIALCGDSAGGNLAAALSLKHRASVVRRILHLALLCPALDCECGSPSMLSNARGYMLSRELMQWFWSAYLPDPAARQNALASPILAENLSGMPPTSVVTAEFDPLRDEAERFADRLRACGVQVTSRRYLGMIHDFMTMPDVTQVARRCISDIASDLAASLTPISQAAHE